MNSVITSLAIISILGAVAVLSMPSKEKPDWLLNEITHEEVGEINYKDTPSNFIKFYENANFVNSESEILFPDDPRVKTFTRNPLLKTTTKNSILKTTTRNPIQKTTTRNPILKTTTTSRPTSQEYGTFVWNTILQNWEWKPHNNDTTMNIKNIANENNTTTCENDCKSYATPEFNPLCGSNGVTYLNPTNFKCAIDCGQNITVVAYRRCKPIVLVPA